MTITLLKNIRERNLPINFPWCLDIKGDRYIIASKEHYDYLNEMSNKLYQVMFGCDSQPGHNYFCANHPQESICFIASLIIDDWSIEHEFNEKN